jgi:molecular chaperone HtpG
MNEIEERHRFKLHLPGLLKVLAEHLYADKHVAIRELIQNAHDSCLRRAVEGKDLDYQPRLDVFIDPARQMLTIGDNGCGLTAAEIDRYLATIGRSYTRELRERLAVMSHQHASELIGQFGFGFLSAFLIASEVVLVTRSVKGDGALRWRSTGDESYSLEPAERTEAGTTIQLRVKPGAAFVLQETLLVETIQKYADFLPIPIHVNGSPYRDARVRGAGLQPP